MNPIYIVARFNIEAQRTGEFETAVAACVEGVRTGEPETFAYEWFMSENRREALVIEAYQSSEAIFSHMKNSSAHMPALMQFARSSALGLGTPSEELRKRLSGRISFAPRFVGLDKPDVGDCGSGEDIRTIARFRIHPGKMEDFKRGVIAGLEIVAAKDPGTTAYEWFLDEAAGQCTVIEQYRDVGCLVAHTKNVGHLVRGLMQSADLSADIGIKGPGSTLAALAKLPMSRFAFLQGLRP
jgi:quinol monooxygenase YgiN